MNIYALKLTKILKNKDYWIMTIKINHKISTIKKTLTSLVLFTDEKFNLQHLKRSLSIAEFSYISDLLKTDDLKKKKLILFELNSKKNIVLVL